MRKRIEAVGERDHLPGKGRKREVEGAGHLPEKLRKDKDGLRPETWNRAQGADPLSKKGSPERGRQSKDNPHFLKNGTKTEGNNPPQGTGRKNKCGLLGKKSRDIGGLFQGKGTDTDIPLLGIDKRWRIEMLEGRDPPLFRVEIGKDAPLHLRRGIDIIDRHPFPPGSATGYPVPIGSIGSRIGKGSLHLQGSTMTTGSRSIIGYHLLPGSIGSKGSGHPPENSRSGMRLGSRTSGLNTEITGKGNILFDCLCPIDLIKEKM